MAGGACGTCTVLLHLLAHGQNLAVFATVLQRGNIRRRGRGRRPQYIFQQPFAPQNHRSPGGIGSSRQEASLSQESSAVLVAQNYTPKVAAVNIRNPVVPRETFINERVIRVQQVG